MALQIKMAGILLLCLALLHAVFPKYFKWSVELAALGIIHRQMMFVHTFFIAVAVFLMGLLCITAAPDMLQTALGKKICIGLSVFWFLRLIAQFFGYSTVLWKGKVLETSVHILFTLLWIYLSTIFFLAWLE